MSSTAAAKGSSEDGADPLAAREQAVAHRLFQAGGRGLFGEAQALEVVLDEGTQVVGVASGAQGRRRITASFTIGPGVVDDDAREAAARRPAPSRRARCRRARPRRA